MASDIGRMPLCLCGGRTDTVAVLYCRLERYLSSSAPVPVPVEMRRMPSGPLILTVAVFRPSVPHVTCRAFQHCESKPCVHCESESEFSSSGPHVTCTKITSTANRTFV